MLLIKTKQIKNNKSLNFDYVSRMQFMDYQMATLVYTMPYSGLEILTNIIGVKYSTINKIKNVSELN